MTSAEFTYEKSKVIQALRYHFVSQKDIRILVVVVNVFTVIAAVLYYLKKATPMVFLTSSLLWLMIMAMIWFLMPSGLYRGNRTFKDHFTATLGDNAFSIRNREGGRSWDWNKVFKFVESPHFFHIYFSQKAFFLVPKEAFGDRVQQAREILRSKISSV